MSIISNLMALLEEERQCIEQTGCLRGHTKQDPGVYYAPHNPWADTDREYKINWEDVQPVRDVAKAQAYVDEYLRGTASCDEYLNKILALYYSKPAITTQQVAYESHRRPVEPGITISEYSY